MNEFLASVLSGINSVIGNYGWSMVVFTILIKALLIPMDYKSRKSMRRMSALAPQTAKLQKKYANDKEKLNQKTAELYRKEKINPMSGCVPMLISMPILFIMFAAMRIIANTELAKQAIDLLVTGVPTNESWL
ncbi:MAG: membrane protein insertase YidC, partial [Clostridia bacterium]